MNVIGRAFMKMHVGLLRRSGGKKFNMGDRLLILRTKGAKSGKLRENPLMFLADGDDLVIAGSNGGAPRAPVGTTT